MTAQISDKIIFDDDSYSLLSVKPHFNFSPYDYGIRPAWASTACWRGYWCKYSISEDGIVLKDFYVNSANGKYPEINGVTPNDKDNSMGHKAYIGVNIPISYTGTVRIGRGFIHKYYVHMGFQSDWKYEEVKDLVFEDGRLVRVLDLSEEMKNVRKQEDDIREGYIEALRKGANDDDLISYREKLLRLSEDDGAEDDMAQSEAFTEGSLEIE